MINLERLPPYLEEKNKVVTVPSKSEALELAKLRLAEKEKFSQNYPDHKDSLGILMSTVASCLESGLKPPGIPLEQAFSHIYGYAETEGCEFCQAKYEEAQKRLRMAIGKAISRHDEKLAFLKSYPQYSQSLPVLTSTVASCPDSGLSGINTPLEAAHEHKTECKRCQTNYEVAKGRDKSYNESGPNIPPGSYTPLKG